MSFESCDHQARIVVLIRYVNIRLVLRQILNDIQPPVEARRPQRRRVRLRRVINVRPSLDQRLNNIQVT